MSKMLVLISALALLSLSEATFGGTCEARCSARCEKAQGSVGSAQGAVSHCVGICLGNCRVTRAKKKQAARPPAIAASASLCQQARMTYAALT
jgi:hypothetical protein